MKNILLPICLVAAALCCGCNGKRENTAQEYVPNNPELIRRMESQLEASKKNDNRLIPKEKTIDKDTIRQKFKILANTYFPSLPDGILSATTHQLYRDAWAVPEDNIIDVGNRELYLSYFILGYVADSVGVESLSLFSRNDSTLAKVITRTYYDDKSWDGVVDLYLVEENGQWVIDDFKEYCVAPTSYIYLKQYLRNYIEEHRRYFRSEEWKSFVENARNNGFSAAADERLKEIDEYFAKYPDMPSDSTIVQMFNAIAKREFSAAAEDVFSSALFQLYRDTWAVPNDGFCNMCCGDDGPDVAFLVPKEEEDSSFVEHVDIDWAIVKVHVLSYREGRVNLKRCRCYTFHLIAENGRWVIDDCDNVSISHTIGDMKQLFREYINEHREYLRSDDWKDYIEKERKSAEKCENAEEREQWLQSIDESVKAVDDYFAKYPD